MKHLRAYENNTSKKYWKIRIDGPYLKFSCKKLGISRRVRHEFEMSLYEVGTTEPYIYILNNNGEWNWNWIETDENSDNSRNWLEGYEYMGELDLSDSKEVQEYELQQTANKYNL
jgi:hypothetical protein